MTFSLVIGLAVDYDIFLSTCVRPRSPALMTTAMRMAHLGAGSRVREFRLDGYTDEAAVIKGMTRTGHIITSAGVIMCIAFGFAAQRSVARRGACPCELTRVRMFA
jgi:hypothetical protein